MKTLLEKLNLFTDGNDAYTFAPSDSVGLSSLTIHRTTGDIILNPPYTPASPTAVNTGKTVYGIYGIISLSITEYIIIITGREQIGRYLGHNVYKATNFDILPLSVNVSIQDPPHPVEGHLLSLVRSHLKTGNFIFSYGADLTRRLQVQHDSQEKDEGKALWEIADDRFFWNKFLQSRLIESSSDNSGHDLSPYILPVIYGTFDTRPTVLENHQLRLCLISRRSRYRAGTRYFRRGIDKEGHVANFNETEQVLFVETPSDNGQKSNELKFSFVQIRGSVPVFWAEINTLQYKPDLQVMDLPETTAVMKSHFQELASLYGKQTLVNLVNHKGHEKPVKEAYERYSSEVAMPNVQYHYFDFHTECKHMRWDRISVLVDKIQDDLEEEGYLQIDENNVVKRQQGVVRTNCMDNLDRTNVVQAFLAKRTLNIQLQSIGVLSPGASIDDYEEFSKDFREMWADHADQISLAYAGSGALKTDFTRTNKRTRQGALEDGYKSVLRYVRNNYFDGPRQDAFDLMTGTWIPRKSPAALAYLLADERPLLIRAAPLALGYSLFMILAGMTLPRTSDYALQYYFGLWFIIAMLAFTIITKYGISYVRWPLMLPLTDIIYYDGPGFRSARNGMGLDSFGRFISSKINQGAGAGAKWIAGSRARAGSRSEEIELGKLKRVD